MMDTRLSTIIDGCEDGKVDISEIVKLKKNITQSCKDEIVDFKTFKEKFEDFRFKDEEKMGEVFDKENNFQTSVRGIKVRGVFDTKREADVRASVLQRLDPNFDVFVGQVGYWCPWDPNPQKIDDIEYLNKDLNKLVKEYKANEAKKDQFYNEQKTQRQKDSLSAEERLKHQQGLSEMREYQNRIKNNKQEQLLQQNNNLLNTTTFDSIISNSDDNTNTINQSIITEGNENSLNSETITLQSDDPWMARKLEKL